MGPFIEAWIRTRGSTRVAKQYARAAFLQPLLQHLHAAGLDHISEIADGEPPHTPRGCPFQAWSLSEILRLSLVVLADDNSPPPPRPAVAGTP
jgi:glycogen debranching enzyme